MFGEHCSKEYAIDIDQLEYTLNRFKDTYSDDILKIVDSVWQKEKPCEFEDYEEVCK